MTVEASLGELELVGLTPVSSPAEDVESRARRLLADGRRSSAIEILRAAPSLSVDARIEGSDLEGPVKLTTVNGSIHLDVNDDINADVEARWVSGGLRSELPLTVRGRMSRTARGQFGDGGHEVSLSTVNGSIEVR